MSLVIRIDPGEISKSEAIEVQNNVNKNSRIIIRSSPDKFLFLFKLKINFYIDSFYDFLLNENAEDFLELTEEGINELLKTLDNFHKNYKKDISFEYIWYGETHRKIIDIDYDEFKKLLMDKKVELFTRYDINFSDN